MTNELVITDRYLSVCRLHLVEFHMKKLKEKKCVTFLLTFLFRNVSLWTPLDCAAAKGWMKTAKVLLEGDSPVDPMDKAKVSLEQI